VSGLTSSLVPCNPGPPSKIVEENQSWQLASFWIFFPQATSRLQVTHDSLRSIFATLIGSLRTAKAMLKLDLSSLWCPVSLSICMRLHPQYRDTHMVSQTWKPGLTSTVCFHLYVIPCNSFTFSAAKGITLLLLCYLGLATVVTHSGFWSAKWKTDIMPLSDAIISQKHAEVLHLLRSGGQYGGLDAVISNMTICLTLWKCLTVSGIRHTRLSAEQMVR